MTDDTDQKTSTRDSPWTGKPWEWKRDAIGNCNLRGANGTSPVLMATDYGESVEGCSEDDEALIALAPNMADAILRYTKDWTGGPCDDCEDDWICPACELFNVATELRAIGAADV